MIRGYCRSNLDEAHGQEWPKEFVEVPRPGDCVRAKNRKMYSELKVYRVVHIMMKNPDFDPKDHPYCPEYIPAIEVELNK